MALTHVATSSPAFNQTNVAPADPGGAVEGDHVFLFATAKWIARDFDPASHDGWTSLFNDLLPSTPSAGSNNVAGQGQVRAGVFYRRVPAGGLTTPVIDMTGTGTAGAQIFSGTLSVWRSDSGSDLDISLTTGDRTGTVTTQTVVGAADPGFVADDTALLFSEFTDDAPTMNSFSLAADGADFSALAELADAGSALGDDTHVGLHTGTVITGPATSAPSFTVQASSGAGSRGGTVFLRLRETGGGTPLPPEGTATGSWDFTGEAVGSTPAGPAIPTGTGTGAWDFTGSAIGKRTSKGSAAGTFAYVGAATGKRTPKASAAGAFTFTGTAAGKTTRRGSTSGAWSYAGAATGRTVKRGTASGTAAWAGAATGAAPTLGVSDGAATGTWAYVGTATGARASRGTSTGTTAYLGVASGTAPVVGSKSGTATGSVAWSGTAAGKRAPKASAAGTTAYVGTASGITARAGTATGAWLYTGTAVGRTPGIGRDITVTVGGLTSRTLVAALTARATATQLRARALTATLED